MDRFKSTNSIPFVVAIQALALFVVAFFQTPQLPTDAHSVGAGGQSELVPRIFNYYTKSGSPCVSSVRWAKRAIDSRIWSADLVHLNGFGSSLWASR